MHFLNPTYLWAFLGLLVPLAIHLWNKKESKTIKIGTVQLLKESNVKKSKQFQFNELLLLLLRLLIIGLIVLIFAAPQIKKQQYNTSITYIVEPTLINHKSVKTIRARATTHAKFCWLQDGFPEIKTQAINKAPTNIPNYWQLAKAMDNLPTDSIVVFTRALLTGIKGTRPKTNKNIEWIVLPLKNELEKVLKTSQKEKLLELISISSSNEFTALKKAYNAINSDKVKRNITNDSLVLDPKSNREIIALDTPSPIKIQLFYTKHLTSEKNYIEAAFQALSKYLNEPITLISIKNKADLKASEYDLTVWLSEEDTSRNFNKLLMYKPDNTSNTLIAQSASNTVFYLTRRLNTENTITQHLAEQLLNLLDRHEETYKQVNRLDQRQLALEELLPRVANKADHIQKASFYNLSLWLWPLLMVLLIVERLIAKWRKQ